MHNRLIDLKNIKPYLGKFSLVGISGIFVNQGCLTLFVSVFGLSLSIAGILAIEISIVSNFLLNNFWTWRDNKTGSFIQRFIKYHAVTLLSGGVNYLILLTLTSFGLHYFISNLIGMGFAALVNFILNHYWTFQK